MLEDLRTEFENYIVVPAEIRHDYCGMHHTGYDAIDATNIWGIYVDAEGNYVLAN